MVLDKITFVCPDEGCPFGGNGKMAPWWIYLFLALIVAATIFFAILSYRNKKKIKEEEPKK